MDLEETLQLERGQNLFEIHIQKVSQSLIYHRPAARREGACVFLVFVNINMVLNVHKNYEAY